MRRERSWADWFVALGAGYLLLPNLLFLIAWMEPWIGWPVAAICLLGYVRLLVRPTGAAAPAWDFSPRNIAVVGLLALLWTALSGAGGLVPQSSDYLKHNLVYHDLLELSWPVTYDGQTAPGSFLCYAVGYYLVPAGIGRWFGEGCLNPVSFLWLGAGLFLFFLWLAAFDPKRPITTVAIFLCTAGVLFLWLFLKDGRALSLGRWHLAGAGFDPSLRALGIANNNYDPFTRVHYQPQHAIVGWLGAGLLYELTWVRRQAAGALFVWATTLIWSPFTSAALLMIPLISLKRVRPKEYFEWSNAMCGGPLLLLLASFYCGHEALDSVGAIWSFSPDRRWLVLYPLFIATQTFPLVACVYLIDRQERVLQGWRTLFYGMAVFLALLPLYKVGFHGDLRMQASGPPMVFISLGVAACLSSPGFSSRRPICLLLLVIFALGAIYPIALPIYNLASNREDFQMKNGVAADGSHNLSEITDKRFNAPAQYLGSKESFVYRVLLRKKPPIAVR